MQPETFRRWIKSLRFHIEDQLVDGEKVVTRMTANVWIRETEEAVRQTGGRMEYLGTNESNRKTETSRTQCLTRRRSTLSTHSVNKECAVS